jgi:hypothetical protein
MIEWRFCFTVAATIRPPPPIEIPELALRKSKTKKRSSCSGVAAVVVVVARVVVVVAGVVVVL